MTISLPSDLFSYLPPLGNKARPILLSVPHSGTKIPDHLKHLFKSKYIAYPEDTDWFVNRLYDFAPNLGIGMIVANYSRYVIDLNRDPSNAHLYTDGRAETELIPSKSFAGEPLGTSDQKLSPANLQARLDGYYWPYHHKIAELLKELLKRHQQVLFFDAHSIKRFVPTIRNQPFPDMILGNQDHKTCHPQIIEVAKQTLIDGGFKVSCNEPFKGGHLTRSVGKPQQRVHALQLEMPQDNYMDERTCKINEEKFKHLQKHLSNMLEQLAYTVENL